MEPELSMSKTVENGHVVAITLGHPLLDAYLEFVAVRARPNTLLATGYDLKVFFSVIAKHPSEVTSADVLAFITAQRAPRRGPTVVRLEDGEAGMSARTIKRRLASISGLFGYLIIRGDAGVEANPVPRGLATRRRAGQWLPSRICWEPDHRHSGEQGGCRDLVLFDSRVQHSFLLLAG